MIRVGRIKYGGRKPSYPKYPGFVNIIVLVKGQTKWGILGPYDLKDDRDRIMENIWQGSKVYEKVPVSIQTYSRRNSTIVWEHPAENHVRDGELTSKYRAWRKKLMENIYPVRYPVGFKHRHECLYALAEDENGEMDEKNKLDYIESRKKIYVPLYIGLVKKQPRFRELKKKLQKNNLLIIEVDGPHQESMAYYQKTYGVADDFIEDDTMLITEKNIKIMLNDPKHPFGHGYCLPIALLEMDYLDHSTLT